METGRFDTRKLPRDLQQELRHCAAGLRHHLPSLNQKGIARACGVSQPTISRWLRKPLEVTECPLLNAKRLQIGSLQSGLSYAQIARLKQVMGVQGAGRSWSNWDIRLIIRREFGFDADTKAVDGLMRRLGLERRVPHSRELHGVYLDFLNEHPDRWFKVSEIVEAVGRSQQVTSRALIQLALDGVIRVEEDRCTRYAQNLVRKYRALPVSRGSGLAAMFGMVAIQPTGGRIVRGRDMADDD